MLEVVHNDLHLIVFGILLFVMTALWGHLTWLPTYRDAASNQGMNRSAS